MAFEELFEKSYKDTVWLCVDNQNNPDQDKSSAQFHKCFLAQSRAILEDRELKETATIEIGVYHNEINAPGTPPINKYYLEINLGVRQDIVKRDEIWKNRLLGGAGPQPSKIDRVEFFLDEAKIGEATSPTSADVFEFTCTVTKGIHRVKATAHSKDFPPKTSDEVEFEVIESESKITCRIIAPKPGEEIPEGSLTIQVEAKVSA